MKWAIECNECGKIELIESEIKPTQCSLGHTDILVDPVEELL